MSIATNLTALENAKTSIAQSIVNKGVTVGVDDGFSNFSALIDTITSGGESFPSWLTEYEIQTYEPLSDTNENLDFTLTMTNTPNVAMVLSDFTTGEVIRDWIGCFGQNFFGQHDATMVGFSYYGGTPPAINSTGLFTSISAVSNTNITISPYVFGGTACYWRAGHTYKILTMKVAI